MKKNLFWVFTCSLLFACNNEQPADQKSTASSADTTVQPYEFADAKYTEIGKRGIAALSSGDIDAWMNDFADEAKYFWNGGDSLIGKPAISAYWKTKRTTVVDSLNYMNDIWMPVKVNIP